VEVNNSIFIGQLQSSTGERVDLSLQGTNIVFDVIASSEFSRARSSTGFAISVDEIDKLRGLLLNARVRAGVAR
jgi:hypothetical protein